MVSRKNRIPVVLDTNVFVRALKTRSADNPNQRTLRLWLLERRVQLIVSDDLVVEYLGVFKEVLRLSDDLIDGWRQRFTTDSRSTVANLGRRYTECRDPDDNSVLATAAAGRAAYLVTNDRDLLELAPNVRRSLRFRILTPRDFLQVVAPE